MRRLYVVTSDTGTVVLCVNPDRTMEGYESYRSYLARFEPHGCEVSRSQAAEFLRYAREERTDVFAPHCGLLRVEG